MSKISRATHAVFEFLTVAICTVAFAVSALAICASLLGHNSAGSRDFVEYWAAGQQLVHHANPYDGVAIRALELSIGFPPTAPTLYLGNPPTALWLVMPLGFVSPTVGEWLWEIVLLLCLIFSVHTIRGMLGSQQSRLYLLLFAFAPVMTCLLAGQIALFLLLGLVLFLRLHPRHPFLAGAALWLCLLKPHLFLPFGIVLIAWILFTRNYKVVAGTASALVLSSLTATALEPGIWSHYRAMMHEQRIDQLDLPSISVLLRQQMYPHSFWVQCLPALAGCIWGLFYFFGNRNEWSWLKHGSLLMLVSVVAAPYSWFMDQTILIPSLLYGLYTTRSRSLVAVLALLSALLETIALQGAGLYSRWYLWSAPIWLAWFVIATRMRPERDSSESLAHPSSSGSRI